MSHAVVIIALQPDDIKNNDNNIEQAISLQMFPFDENGECFKDGSRWDWYVIGGRWNGFFNGINIIQKKDINIEKFIETKKQERIDCYNKAKTEKDQTHIEFLYGVKPEETLEEYLNRQTYNISAYAFLQNRHWNEGERMGWFGGTVSTECEIKNPDNPDIAVNKCLFKDEETGARIVVWNEPYELWAEHYYKRFIEPLSDDVTLVAVDYHV